MSVVRNVRSINPLLAIFRFWTGIGWDLGHGSFYSMLRSVTVGMCQHWPNLLATDGQRWLLSVPIIYEARGVANTQCRSGEASRAVGFCGRGVEKVSGNGVA